MAKSDSLRWLKFAAAVCLLPLCAGAAVALFRVIRASGDADVVWVALLGGAACWWVIYLLLPKPMLAYVFGHEWTHAIWAWLFGGKVKRIKVTSKGGHVVVTRSNFLIDLAPYFFPFYVFIVCVIFGLGHLVWNLGKWMVWFHMLAGMAYAFHVTLTWHILKFKQSDISQHGVCFSAVIIFLGNAAVLAAGISILAGRVSPLTALGWCGIETGRILARLGNIL